jgi:AcrR family transcriptional regulator
MTTAAVNDSTGLLPSGQNLSASKRKLYEAALTLFGERGFHAVSMRDVAQVLGQQPSAIYFHVASKEELLFDLAVIGHLMHRDALRDAVLDAGADPAEQLRAVCGAHVRVHLDYPSMARLTNRELRALTPEHLQHVLAIRTQSEQIIVDVLERGVRMGEFHTDDPFLTGKVIGAMGIRLPEWWTPDAPRSRDEILERYVNYALKLVAPEAR